MYLPNRHTEWSSRRYSYIHIIGILFIPTIYKNEKYAPYDDNYVGCVRRSMMGTSFELVDDGFPNRYRDSFPEWIGSPRRQLLKIEYETNILANKPRRFDISFYNMETKMNDCMHMYVCIP